MFPELMTVIALCAPQVHPSTMVALVHHESRANPYAIGINKGARLDKQAKSRDEAIKIVKDLIAKGIDFDAGLGQINVRNWNWLQLKPETVFEPCTNLRAAQTVLIDCYVRAAANYPHGQPALQAALSCYNTGNFTAGKRNGYVHRVYAAANQKVPPIGGHDQQPQHQPQKQPERDQPIADGFQRPEPDGFSKSDRGN